MEEKMNQEILGYRENVFWGFSLRQCIFIGAAVVCCAFLFLRYNTIVSQEILSWLCIFAATPFVLLGFMKWHGMPAEKVLLVWLKDTITPRELPFRSTNYTAIYFEKLLKRIKKEEFNNVIDHAEKRTGKP